VSAALFVLAVGILFTVPLNSVRLLAKRLVAFVLDLVLLGLFTLAVVGLLFRTEVVKPSAIVSLVVVWAWILLFVLFDWGFAGTPGKLLFGLRLKSRSEGRPSFITCLARDLVILVVSVIGPGRILMMPTATTIGAFAQWSIALALLSFFPLSIVFSGGQSLPDLFLGTLVLTTGSSTIQYPTHLHKRGWLALVVASLLIGVIFAAAPSSPVLKKMAPTAPMILVQTSGEREARIAEGLRGFLRPDFPGAEDYLQEVRVSSVIGELPTAGDEISAPLACQESFKSTRSYQIVREQISGSTPTIAKTIFFENLIHSSDMYVKRPAFLVFQVASRDSFGVFNIEFSENHAFCLMDSDGKPQNLLVGLSRTFSIPASMSEPTALLLGDLDSYSRVENVPIW
jgi:uncharacterized RDD family membrane protein YckC